MPGLALDDGAPPFDLGLAAVNAQQLRGVTARRERIAQRVSEHREEFVLALIHLLQCFFRLTARRHIETDADDVTMTRVLHEPGLVINPTRTACRMSIPILDLAFTDGRALF